MISSSSVSLTLRRRSYSTSDSCVPRGGAIRCRWTGRQQVQQLPLVAGRLAEPAGQHVVAAGGIAGASTPWRPASTTGPRWSESSSRSTIRSASPTSSQVGGAFAGLEHLAFDAVVGAVAIGHVFVGRAEEVVFVVSSSDSDSASARRRREPRRPSRTAAPANTPRRWLRGSRGTSAPAANAARADGDAGGGGPLVTPAEGVRRDVRPAKGPPSTTAPGRGTSSLPRPTGSLRPG